MKLHTAAVVQYFRPEIVVCLRFLPDCPGYQGIPFHGRVVSHAALLSWVLS